MASRPGSVLFLLLSMAGALITSGARADGDEDDGGRPDLMREPITFTDVVDAFDDNDVFDLNLSAGYLRTWEIATIQRQFTDGTTFDGRMSGHWNDVANYERGVNILNIGLDVGVFRDLAVYARLPLLLSDDRSLGRIGTMADADARLASPMGPVFAFDGDGTMHSPTRSGVDYMAVGIAWSLLNQHRDSSVPTWMLMLEGRFNLGDPMHACRREGDTNRCNGGMGDPMAPPAAVPTLVGGSAGVGRGMNALRIETRASWRYEVIEPYAGLAFQMEWPGYSSSQFLPSGALAGYINTLPPIQGRFTLGAAIIPWEDRERFQRFTLDLRLTGDYVSEGHEYSPLFDALGSSDNPYLTLPNLEGIADTAADEDGLARSAFTGMTDVQSHGRFGGTLYIEMQAARYIRFTAGAGFLWSPPYVLTQADACNPNVDQVGADPRRVGTCRGGIINPHHRPVLDMPGNRFRVEGVWQIDLSFMITAMF